MPLFNPFVLGECIANRDHMPALMFLLRNFGGEYGNFWSWEFSLICYCVIDSHPSDGTLTFPVARIEM
jgi:hypothetical protein